MALAVSLRFSFVDAKGKTSFTKVNVPNGFAISDYIEFGQGIAQLMTNISEGQITGASATFGLDISGAGLKAVASGLADAGQKAFFIFRSAVAGFTKRMFVPTLSELKVSAGSDDIDQADVDVAAFITAMEDGIVVTGGTISPTDSRAQDLVAVSSAKENFLNRS